MELRQWVVLSPLADRHGNLAELLLFRAVLMHVARGKKSVVTHRRQIAEWLPPITLSFDDSDAGITRSPRNSAPRVILRSRREYDIVGHAEFEKLGSRQNADDARGAATGNLEEHTARQAENAWEGIGRGRNVSRAGEILRSIAPSTSFTVRPASSIASLAASV